MSISCFFKLHSQRCLDNFNFFFFQKYSSFLQTFHPALQVEESYFPLQRDRKIETHTVNAQSYSAVSLGFFFVLFTKNIPSSNSYLSKFLPIKYLFLRGLSCMFALKSNSFGARTESFAKKAPR